MTRAVRSPVGSHAGGQATAGRGTGWRAQHYLAVVAVAAMVYQSFGWVGWLADGPVTITQYRDTADESWRLARVWEGLALTTLVVIGTYVVRKVKRERRFVIEAQFCVAGLLTYWQDPVSNFMQPLFFNSANWVNLNEWTGNLPFVRNPDAGRLPAPVLFGLPLYISGFLAFALIMKAVLGRLRTRYPNLSGAQLILIAMGLGMLVDVALEVPIYLTGLWAFPGQPDIGLFANTGHKYPLTEALAGAVFFAVLASMIFFRDDRGQTLMERGLDLQTPRRRTLLSQLGLIGVFNAVYLVSNIWWVAFGTGAGEYKPMEAHTVAGMCDAPGFTNTRYGPCPGSERYRIPLPGALPGERPGGSDEFLNGPRLCATCAPLRIGPPASEM